MPTTDYTPTVQDLANLLRARTRDANGNLVGNFVDDVTTPGATDASGLIQQAADDVGESIGQDIDPSFWPGANRLVLYLAAANVELSYFPEQAAANNSMYDKLMARYNAKLKDLQEDIAEFMEEQVEDTQSQYAPPSGGFPEALGWGTVEW